MNNKLLYLALVLGLSFVANASDQLARPAAQQEEVVTQSDVEDNLDRDPQGDRLTSHDLMNSPELVSELKSIKISMYGLDTDDWLQILPHARKLEHLDWGKKMKIGAYVRFNAEQVDKLAHILANLPELKTLVFERCRFEVYGYETTMRTSWMSFISALGKLTHLQKLNLKGSDVDGMHGNDVFDLFLGSLRNLRNLREFAIAPYEVFPIPGTVLFPRRLVKIVETIATLPNLERLSITEKSLLSAEYEYFERFAAALGSMTNLQELDLSENDSNGCAADMVVRLRKNMSTLGTALERLSKLQSVDIHWTNLSCLTAEEIQTFVKALGNSKHLQKLNLKRCQLGEMGPEKLAVFADALCEYLPNLQELNLKDNELEQIPPESVKQFIDKLHSQLPKLVKIKLNTYDLDDDLADYLDETYEDILA